MCYNHTTILCLNNNFIKADAIKEEYNIIAKASYTETYTDNNTIEMFLTAFNTNIILNKNAQNVLDIIHEYTEI